MPTAISLSPFLAAITDVTSSGREVPNATMVSPISASLSPNILAISLAPSTDISPPITIPASPTTNISILFHIGICILERASSCSELRVSRSFKPAFTVVYIKNAKAINKMIPSTLPRDIAGALKRSISNERTPSRMAAKIDNG